MIFWFKYILFYKNHFKYGLHSLLRRTSMFQATTTSATTTSTSTIADANLLFENIRLTRGRDLT